MATKKLLGKYEQIIAKTIAANKHCLIGVLDDRRIFIGQRKGKPELLVLVESVACYGEIWGHVFWHKEEWVSCLVHITGWFAGKNEEQLIEDFWYNIKKRAGWTYLNFSEDYGALVLKTDSHEKALANLERLIRNFTPDAFAIEGESDPSCYQSYGYEPLIHGSLYSRWD